MSAAAMYMPADHNALRMRALAELADAMYFAKHLRRARQDAPHLVNRFAAMMTECHNNARTYLRATKRK